jgi:hypothetical protein
MGELLFFFLLPTFLLALLKDNFLGLSIGREAAIAKHTYLELQAVVYKIITAKQLLMLI